MKPFHTSATPAGKDVPGKKKGKSAATADAGPAPEFDMDEAEKQAKLWNVMFTLACAGVAVLQEYGTPVWHPGMSYLRCSPGVTPALEPGQPCLYICGHSTC
eukprot:262543-Chlamydomonas_euryale.AAC.5